MSFIMAVVFSLLTGVSGNDQTVSDNKAAVAELTTVLHERKMFIKAHAAEYLIWTGHYQPALQEFLKEERLHGTEPKYRIVIWRILTQAEQDPARKKMWLNKILHVYADLSAPDRIHASETLAKLSQPVHDLYPEVTAKTLASTDLILKNYALWASGYGSEKRMDKVRGQLLHMALTDTAETNRKISAYALRFIKGLSMPQWEQLYKAAAESHKTSPTYTSYVVAAMMTEPANADAKKVAILRKMLLGDAYQYNAGQRIDLSIALANKGGKEDLPMLENFLKNKDVNGKYDISSDEGADLRAAAVYAILKINSRTR